MTDSGSTFGLVLYPDDIYQMAALDMFLDLDFHPIYVLHDKDVDNDGNLKKSHYHVMVKSYQRMTAKRFLTENRLDKCDLHYAEVIHDAKAYINYMLHRTADSKEKHRYDVSELKGDLEFWNKILDDVNNDNFVIFGALLREIKKSGLSLGEFYDLLLQSQRYDDAAFMYKNLSKFRWLCL